MSSGKSDRTSALPRGSPRREAPPALRIVSAWAGSYRKARGVTPEMLEALSWMGRRVLAAKKLDTAERYAAETYKLSAELLTSRKLDEEPRLPIAIVRPPDHELFSRMGRDGRTG